MCLQNNHTFQPAATPVNSVKISSRSRKPYLMSCHTQLNNSIENVLWRITKAITKASHRPVLAPVQEVCILWGPLQAGHQVSPQGEAAPAAASGARWQSLREIQQLYS